MQFKEIYIVLSERGIKMKLNPTVCVVGKSYQIMIITDKEALVSVCVGENTYYCHSNGIRIA